MERFVLLKSLESGLADILYDKWTHCEVTFDEAVEFVLEKGEEVADGTIYRIGDIKGQILGRDYENCILVYDSYWGCFDLYELIGDWD